jgi:hypothetical protein
LLGLNGRRFRTALDCHTFGRFELLTTALLVRVTDNNHTPAAYVIIVAIITLAILLWPRETAFAP